MDKFDIMRRGIPYGPELSDEEKKKQKTVQDRGLMFLCYQTSLSNGFQFIRNRKSYLASRRKVRPLTLNVSGWINADNFPPGKRKFTGGMAPGQDPVVGQLVKGASQDDDNVLQMAIVDGHKKHNQITFEPFIESNGGDYFFTPSLKLMRQLAETPAN